MFNRHILITLAVFVACCLTGASSARQDGQAENDQVRTLQIERRDVLRERVAVVRQWYQEGQCPIERVFDAEKDVIEAELELAKTKDERINLRKQALANAEKIEEVAELRRQSGQATVLEKLESKANRLAAKIQLLREEARQ